MRISNLIVVAWLGVALLATAQNEATSESFSDRTAIEKRLAVARIQLEEHADGDLAGTRELLEKLEAACQYHLAAVESLAVRQAALEIARKTRLAWNGFPGKPPYPILLLDEVRETQAVLESTRLGMEAQIRDATVDLENARTKLKTQQQNARRNADAADKAKSAEAARIEERDENLANLSARIQAEQVARLDLQIKALRLELETNNENLNLTKLQLDALKGKTGLTQAELETIQLRISKEREETIKSMVKTGGNPAGQDPLRNWQAAFLDLESSFWEQRFIAHHSSDPASTRSALGQLRQMSNRIDDWVEIAQLRVAGLTGNQEEIDPGRLRAAMLRLRKQQRLVAFTIEDLEARDAKLPRGTPALDYIGSTLNNVWNAELYLVEETDIVDGRKIPVYKAITVGKVVRLAFILVVGWFALRIVSRRVNGILARRGAIPESTASLAGKWAFGIGLILLVAYAFHAVSIPLTVFAFLGGALAIGIGFGTQTLLKNFISGIILLFERPLRVGDVIEVAGIIGTIKFIGIRASVIQHFDGIETLVPNSTLLENQLTNWTFSNSVIRYSLLVGVAYGSPTREVARILLGVAAEHGLVKDDPPPEVRFDNFADSSLTFNLLFWFDTRKTSRGTLASDLRFMIDKAFSEAGIEISFPQRDIHFDTDKPLRVELSPASIPAASSGSK